MKPSPTPIENRRGAASVTPLENELSHDMFLKDAEISDSWWDSRKHLYVQLFAHCIAHRCTTFISIPERYAHEEERIRLLAAQKAAAAESKKEK